MAWSPDDDPVLESDGSGNLIANSVTKGEPRVVDADTEAIVLTDADEVVMFSTTGALAGTIAFAGATPGKMVTLIMTARNTGDYTMTVVGAATTLTFNAAHETAVVMAVTASTARVISLNGATVV